MLLGRASDSNHCSLNIRIQGTCNVFLSPACVHQTDWYPLGALSVQCTCASAQSCSFVVWSPVVCKPFNLIRFPNTFLSNILKLLFFGHIANMYLDFANVSQIHLHIAPFMSLDLPRALMPCVKPTVLCLQPIRLRFACVVLQYRSCIK